MATMGQPTFDLSPGQKAAPSFGGVGGGGGGGFKIEKFIGDNAVSQNNDFIRVKHPISSIGVCYANTPQKWVQGNILDMKWGPSEMQRKEKDRARLYSQPCSLSSDRPTRPPLCFPAP